VRPLAFPGKRLHGGLQATKEFSGGYDVVFFSHLQAKSCILSSDARFTANSPRS
jgi:hypothetical protein